MCSVSTQMVNCDFNLCWVSARTNAVKKLLTGLVMDEDAVTPTVVNAVATGQCSVVAAFYFLNPDTLEKNYNITKVEFDRVITYLGECDLLQPAVNTRVQKY
jgi:hypothetical protein